MIRPRGEDGPVLQPLSLEVDTERHSNLFGFTAETAMASAREQSCHLNKGKIRRALEIGAP